MGAPYETLLFAVGDGVATVTLNRPERRNPLGRESVNEILHALRAARDEKAVRVIVLTGAGKAFSAGGDLGQMQGTGESKIPPQGDYADLLAEMTRLGKPTIARINGHAMGGGFGLAVSCDLAIASTEAKLGTPEVDVGLFPMMIMAVLRRNVLRKRLVEMMLTGERIDAEEAARLGFVNRAVAPDALDAAVEDLCDKLKAKSPVTLRLGIEAFHAQDKMALDEALPYLRDMLGKCLATDDAREGLMAFVEKRQPKWTGR